MNGYLSEIYAQALADYGRPVRLADSGSWVLERAIPGTGHTDLVGCYPLMACRNWEALPADIECLQDRCVSITMVADPLGAVDRSLLERLFTDVFKPFKTHFIVDLTRDYERELAVNHVRNARKALQGLVVRREDDPMDFVEGWISLYAGLVERHAITGVAAFSPASFRAQFQTPGLVVYSARAGDRLAGMALFYRMDRQVYYHLAAYSEEGYNEKASFGIFRKALADFKQEGLELLNLGGGAGLQEKGEDGLMRFKKGWANDTRMAFLCGKICDRPIYEALSNGRARNGYFPAYRQDP